MALALSEAPTAGVVSGAQTCALSAETQSTGEQEHVMCFQKVGQELGSHPRVVCQTSSRPEPLLLASSTGTGHLVMLPAASCSRWLRHAKPY